MHTFTIFRQTGDECDGAMQPTNPLLEFDNGFDACCDAIRMEQKTGLKYEVRVTESAKAKKETT